MLVLTKQNMIHLFLGNNRLKLKFFYILLIDSPIYMVSHAPLGMGLHITILPESWMFLSVLKLYRIIYEGMDDNFLFVFWDKSVMYDSRRTSSTKLIFKSMEEALSISQANKRWKWILWYMSRINVKATKHWNSITTWNSKLSLNPSKKR